MANEPINVIVKQRGARKTGRAIAGIGTTAQASNKALTLMKGTLLTLGVGIGLAASIKVMADFSQEMSTVKAITQATEDQFKDLREEAKLLGATTRFSATEAAQGMTFLARAGFGVEAVMDSIGATLNLAQAGALGLGEAADIASNVLTGFRIDVEDAARVVDVLALAANSGNTTVGQLGEAMKFVAPVAAGLGVSLETAAAAATALSDAGLQASLAGTGLRRVMSELESPSSKTIKILNTLGLSADDVKISNVGLTEAIVALKEAGVDTGLALELMGDRGGPAFEVLSSSIPKVEALEKALLGAEGTAKRIAEVMDDNLNGALLSVRSAIQAVVIEMGDLGAQSFLTTFFFNLADGIRSFSKNLDEAAAVLKAFIPLILILIAPSVVSGVIALGSAFLGVGVSIITLGGALSGGLLLALGPVIAALVALAASGGLLFAFRDKIRVGKDGVLTLGQALKGLREEFGLFDEALEVNTDPVEVFSEFTEGTTGFVEDQKSLFAELVLAAAGMADEIVGIARATGAVLDDLGRTPEERAESAAREKKDARSFLDIFTAGRRGPETPSGRNAFDEFLEERGIEPTTVSPELAARTLAARLEEERSRAPGELGGGPTPFIDTGIPRNLIEEGPDTAEILGNLAERASRAILIESEAEKFGALVERIASVSGEAYEESVANGIVAGVDKGLKRALEEEQARVDAFFADAEKDILAEEASFVTEQTAVQDRQDEQLKKEQLVSLRKVNELKARLDPSIGAQQRLEAADDIITESVFLKGKTALDPDEAQALRERQAFLLRAQLEPLQTINEELAEEKRLLGFTNEQRAIENEISQISLDLMIKGKPLNEEQEEALRKEIALLIELNKQKTIEENNINRFNESLENLNRVREVTRQQEKDGIITGQQATRVILETEAAAGRAAGTFSGQLKGSLADLQLSFMNFGEEVGGILQNVFKDAEDALVSFVQTGKLDFSSLIDSMIADLIRLAVRQSILRGITNIFSFASAGLTPADGGSGGAPGAVTDIAPDPNRVVFMALPTPSPIPARASAAAFAPQINVSVESNGNSSEEGNQEMAEKLGIEAKRAMNEAMVQFFNEQNRPGGLINNSGRTM